MTCDDPIRWVSPADYVPLPYTCPECGAGDLPGRGADHGGGEAVKPGTKVVVMNETLPPVLGTIIKRGEKKRPPIEEGLEEWLDWQPHWRYLVESPKWPKPQWIHEDRLKRRLPWQQFFMSEIPDYGVQDDGSVVVKHTTVQGKGLIARLRRRQ